MNTPGDPDSPRTRPALFSNQRHVVLCVLLAATALGLSATAILYFGRFLVGTPVTLTKALAHSVTDMYLWAALVPLVVWVSRRFKIAGQYWVARVALHWLVGTVLALLELAAYSAILRLAVPSDTSYWETYANAVGGWYQFSFLVYWMMVAGVHAFDYRARYQERQLAAAQLQVQVAKAQLQALRMQIHPHFLFNTLNTIAVYMRERRVDEALEMLTDLGDLLRFALDRGELVEVTLREELQFVGRYLDIEQHRFGDRLRVETNAPPETLDVMVPNMILQPLVENALRHGIAPSVSGGVIQIEASRENGMLRLQVRDDGPGFTPQTLTVRHSGIGLRNTQARLERLYGSAQRMRIGNHPAGGASVTVELPASRTAEGGDFGDE